MSDDPITIRREFLLTVHPPGRQHARLAMAVVAGSLLGLLIAAPFGGVPLAGTATLLPAYAAVVLVVDLIAATLLIAQFAVHGTVSVLVLAIGYLLLGLTVVPWVMTFPGVFSETGLLGAGLQTTATIAAFRRLVFPVAILLYAILQRAGRPPAADSSRTGLLIRSGIGGSLVLTLLVTWLAVAGEQLAPPFMTDLRSSTTIFTAVLLTAMAVALTAAGFLLVQRRRSLLDLWLLVTLAALMTEMILLGWFGDGVRFSLGWWVGRAFGLLSASIVMLALLAETTSLQARLLRSLVAEAQAKDARATLLEALAAALAHELNQPLASIVTNADAATRWLDRPGPELEQARQRLRKIAAEGHCAAGIIDSVRSSFTKSQRRLEPIDPAVLVREATGLMRAEAGLARIKLATDVGGDLPGILGDAVALRQALLNLLRNAIEAIGGVEADARSIRVTCARDGKDIKIAVVDTGSGLEDADRLFAPFYSTKPQGTGLGLMICRTIIEAHGGRIAAHANHPSGAVFEIVLPGSSKEGTYG